MADIVRFGIVYIMGFVLISIYFYNERRWRKFMSSGDRAKCCGTIVDFYQKLRKGPDSTGYIYRLQVKYRTKNGVEIISLSKNTIHSPKDYSVGEIIEISYAICDPKSFYICDDRNQRTLNRFILVFGLLLCVMGTVFVLSSKCLK